METRKEYLGDAVYLTYGDYGVTLTTEDGIRATNTIFLEPEVIQRLVSSLGRSPYEGLLKKGF